MTAVFISVSVDDVKGEPERLLYIFIIIIIVKIILPLRTIAYSKDKNTVKRNTNILFANTVIILLLISLDLKHLLIIISLLQSSE